MTQVIDFFFELYSSLEFWQTFGILSFVNNVFGLFGYESHWYSTYISLAVNFTAATASHFIKKGTDDGSY